VSKVRRDNRDGSHADVREPGITSRYYIALHNLSKLLKETIQCLPNQRKNRIILDLGCGDKPYQPFFAGQYSSYIGVDIDSRSLADINASGEYLPFKNGTFDVCICTQTYEHVIDPEQVTREVDRVLKKKSVFLLSTHAIDPVHNYPSDYWRWTDQGLRILLGEYFSSIVVHEVITPLETISQLAVNYLPTNKLGTLCSILVNKLAVFVGKNSFNTRLPRLVGLYLVVAEKGQN